MEKYLELIRIPYEEPYHINLIVKASNGVQRGELEIYDNADFLKKIASTLEVFPRHSTDSFLWELGSERKEDRFAFYFRFRVFLTNKTGYSAIHLRFNNNADFPELAISEFCIKTEPAEINNLGRLLKEFSKLEKKVLKWNGYDGEIK